MSTSQRSPNNQSGQQSQQRSAPAAPQAPQPVVRVMRLYKGGFYNTNVNTPLMTAEGGCGSTSMRDVDSADFSISPYLLLPDSFGDIYIGDTFSAYVAVVNGQEELNTVFTKVRMELHLLVGEKAIELHDTRAPDPLTQDAQMELKKDEYIDKILATVLSDVSSHTLRVTVTYSIGRGMQEVKTMRKSYRFNVLQPLEVNVAASKVGDQVAVQVLIKNTSQSPLLLEDIQFIRGAAAQGANCNVLTVPFSGGSEDNEEEDRSGNILWGPLKDFNVDNIPVMQPEEQKAFAFLLTKGSTGSQDTHAFIRSLRGPLGHVEVTWCANIGERGVLKSKDVLVANIQAGGGVTEASPPLPHRSGNHGHLSPVSTNKLDLVCNTCPYEGITVGTRFDITIVCANVSTETLSFRVETNPSGSADDGCGLSVELGLNFSSLHLTAGESVEFPCSVYPLRGGVQGVGEVTAISTDTQEVLWRGSELLQVLVNTP